MRILIASLAAALIAVLTFPAEAAPSDKKKHRYSADKKIPAEGRARAGKNHEFGYDASPEHYQVGTREWWRAMDRAGRGGFGDTP
jgi:hypothetical protein